MSGVHDAGEDLPLWAVQQRREAAQWYRASDTAFGPLWTYFYSVGGDVDEFSLDAYLHEVSGLPASQARLLAVAMAEIDSGPQLGFGEWQA